MKRRSRGKRSGIQAGPVEAVHPTQSSEIQNMLSGVQMPFDLTHTKIQVATFADHKILVHFLVLLALVVHDQRDRDVLVPSKRNFWKSIDNIKIK